MSKNEIGFDSWLLSNTYNFTNHLFFWTIKKKELFTTNDKWTMKKKSCSPIINEQNKKKSCSQIINEQNKKKKLFTNNKWTK